MFSFQLRQKLGLGASLALGLMVTGCSETVRQGQSPAYLIINQLEGASGADDEKFSNLLASDVTTNGTVFEDAGRVTFALALKNIGAPGEPTAPTTNNYITITRYHVTFRRIGAEKITLPFGDVDTEIWKRVDADSTVEAQVWLAPSLRYVAVKLRLSNARATVEGLLDSIRVDDTVAQQ